MTIVLALDLATSTGWALSQDGAVDSGVWDLRRHGSGLGERLFGFQSELAALLVDSARSAVVVFETPWVGPKTHQQTARLLMSLAGVTEMVAWEAGAACYEVTAPTWRKHFLGVGKLTGIGSKEKQRKRFKEMAIARCKQLGFDPKTEDEAEALGILDYALASLKVQSLTGAGPLFQGRAA